MVDENGLLIPEALLNLQYGVHLLPTDAFNTICLGPGDLDKVDKKHKVPEFEHDHKHCLKEKQRGAQIMGYFCHPAWVCRTCPCNWHNAMCNRHAAAQPHSKYNPTDKEIEAFYDTHGYSWTPPVACQNFLAFVREHAGEFEHAYNMAVDYETGWFTKWPKVKQDRITASLAVDLPRQNKVKGMVKREPASKEPSKARDIQYYTDMASQEVTGPRICRAQKAFRAVFNEDHYSDRGIGVCFASGMTSLDLARWMESAQNKGVKWFYERDGKNWDSTMTQSHMLLKMEVLRIITGDDDLVAELADAINVMGSHRAPDGFVYRYKIAATTKSGHNDTSLGNSIINAAIAYEALHALGIKGDVLVMGDDLIVAVYDDNGKSANDIAALEAAEGIKPEFARFDYWSDVTFISGRWLPAEEGFVFAPLLGRMLAKLRVTSKNWPEKYVDAWNYSTTCGLAKTLGNIPLYGEWLMANPGRAGSKKIDMEQEMKHKFDLYAGAVSIDRDLAIKHLAALYCIPVAELESAIHFVSCLKPGQKGYVCHPTLERIVAMDHVDVTERPISGVNEWRAGH